MTTLAWTYAAYLVVSVGLTLWVAGVLRRSGTVLLTDGVSQRIELARSVSDLLVVGFYLLTLGFVCLTLRATSVVETLDGAIELLSAKVGGVLVALGIVHFLIFALLGMVRSSAKAAASLEQDRSSVETFDLAPHR